MSHAFFRTTPALVAGFLALASWPASLPAQNLTSPSIIHKVQAANDRLELTVNTSRILTLEDKIPRAQVGNPEILDLTPLSATQIQIYAKKGGVTQVNLWNERNEIHAIDVVVFADVRDLALQMRTFYPSCSVQVFPTATGVFLTGYVDRPDYVSRIVNLAKSYYPDVQDNITVGGAQQVLLHVKVMEISRTKLRDMGFDFANISGGGQDFVASGVSGLLGGLSRDTGGAITTVGTTGQQTLTFGIVDPSNSFFGVLRALQRNQLAKVLAEPNLVTVSGRPAYFQEGGEIPVLIPQGLGTVAVEFRRFGTQVDFVPIVLGNGNIRLEVRPRVSELDNSISVTLNGNTIPGFRVREVDTGVELKAGQTLALAGLIQNRVDSEKIGIPWLSDIPYLGFPFRRVRDQVNEIELLILVRPELAEALDPEEVPPVGPGTSTTNPRNCDLYLKGYFEVPKGLYDRPPGSPFGGPNGMPMENLPPGSRVIQQEDLPVQPTPPTTDSAGTIRSKPMPERTVSSQPLPPTGFAQSAPAAPRSATRTNPASGPAAGGDNSRRTTKPEFVATNPARNNPNNPSKPRPTQPNRQVSGNSDGPGLIGPIGYDLSNNGGKN